MKILHYYGSSLTKNIKHNNINIIVETLYLVLLPSVVSDSHRA